MAASTFKPAFLESIGAISPTDVCQVFESMISTRILLPAVLCVLTVLEREEMLSHQAGAWSAPLSTAQTSQPAQGTLPDVQLKHHKNPGLARTLSTMPAGQRLSFVEDLLRKEVVACIGMVDVNSHAPFMDMGFDSIGLLELMRKVRKAAEVDIPTTIVFDHPTVHQLAQELISNSLEAGAGSSCTPAQGLTMTGLSCSMATIVLAGLACRFPAAANTPQLFWINFVSSHDAIQPVPLSRWNTDSITNCAASDIKCLGHGGFIEDAEYFDAISFGIKPVEAHCMDPQQRWLLDTGLSALYHANHSKDSLMKSLTGVFVGVSTVDFAMSWAEDTITCESAYKPSGSSLSMAAGRISYSIGLEGPAISLDTACSSSLVAVHVAGTSVKTKECNMALAAGVNLMLAYQTTLTICHAGMLSPDCRCKTFDSTANGYVRGEGCGAVCIESSSLAEPKVGARKYCCVVRRVDIALRNLCKLLLCS